MQSIYESAKKKRRSRNLISAERCSIMRTDERELDIYLQRMLNLWMDILLSLRFLLRYVFGIY